MSQPAAGTLTTSERDWLTVRAYLAEHRYDLAVAAAEDYPPDRRMAGTPLLAVPGWMPPAPVPLRDIRLELRDEKPAEAEVGDAVPAAAGRRDARTAATPRRWPSSPPRRCSRTAPPTG